MRPRTVTSQCKRRVKQSTLLTNRKHARPVMRDTNASGTKMKCWIDKLPTEEDYFWGISEKEAYKLGLKLGFFIGMKEKDIDWGDAKAFFFVGSAPNWTQYSFLNIAIARSLGMEVVGEPMNYRFANPKFKQGHIHQYGVFDCNNKILFKGSYSECWAWKNSDKGSWYPCGVSLIK